MTESRIFKVVRNVDGQLLSACSNLFVLPNQYVINYKLKEDILPSVPESKIFCFHSYLYACRFIEECTYSDGTTWEIYVGTGKNVKFMNFRHSNYTLEKWWVLYNSKELTPEDSITCPEETYIADSIYLTKKVYSIFKDSF